jgi:hypothetical protein
VQFREIRGQYCPKRPGTPARSDPRLSPNGFSTSSVYDVPAPVGFHLAPNPFALRPFAHGSSRGRRPCPGTLWGPPQAACPCAHFCMIAPRFRVCGWSERAITPVCGAKSGSPPIRTRVFKGPACKSGRSPQGRPQTSWAPFGRRTPGSGLARRSLEGHAGQSLPGQPEPAGRRARSHKLHGTCRRAPKPAQSAEYAAISMPPPAPQAYYAKS